MTLPKGSFVRLLLVAVCLGAGSTVSADVVTDWNTAALDAIRAARTPPPTASRVAPPGGSGPGIWVPTPPAFAPYLLPQWGIVAPFVMPMTHFFRPGGPPSLDSVQYASDFNEVKGLGAKVGSARTAEQSQIALFWADGAGTETPPGHWNSIAQVVAAQFQNTLDQNARLFALLNLAMADAAICAWDAKYAFDFWRPVTAIQQAGSDGNAATTADPAWESFIVTPPFPEYVSGHSTFSAAAATVLSTFYGTDDVKFSVGSDAFPGVTVAFTSFSAAALEAAASRMYGGIHFRAAIEDGLTAGVGIGERAYTLFLRPEGNRSRK